MKDILIVFGVLLVLVILISTFGGSLRYSERYEEEQPAADKPTTVATPPSVQQEGPPPTVMGVEGPPPSGHPSGMQPMQPVVEGFDGGAYAGFQEDAEEEAT